ncbi:MAG: hypothetical protein QOH12_1646 [Solirubrobacteraceae bacterium]|jgi:hypothetical protein|nr:hypothetical protein [Solirubrobacteraceae bacterium]
MRKRIVVAALGSCIAGLLVVALVGGSTIAQALSYGHLNQIQKRILSGFASSEIAGAGAAPAVLPAAGSLRPAGALENYAPLGGGSCGQFLASNVKVNQNCLNVTDADLQGRAQAQNETSIAQDPSSPTHLVASFNDYRRGDGQCGAAFSVDAGLHWNDTSVPMSFTRGQPTFGSDRQYWQAGGDTSVAWDTKGNAYLSCQVFNRGAPPTSNPDLSSAFYVFRSTQNHGASWNFPGRPVAESSDLSGSGVPAFEDKQLLSVDNHPGSPFQDRVYVSWTEFSADGSAYIWEAYSSDYGEHFSPRHLVSQSSPFCTNTFGAGTPNGNCNENQFSQPFTGRDGALYVAYASFNNQASKPGDPGGDVGGDAVVAAGDNRYQMLLAKSLDGGNTFSAPVKVGDYYDLPDCPTYEAGKDPGRSCVPEKGATANSFFRATNYPSGVVNPTNPRQVVVTFGSYINAHSKEANGCVPAGFSAAGNPVYDGVKTAGACNNDILVSVSNDGGATFTGTSTDPRSLTSVNQDAGQAASDQFWQWADFTRTGTLAVSYYDRQYGADEASGASDISLSGSRNLTGFATRRITSSSMPPPTEFEGLFFGDYAGLSALDLAHPLWSDTRNATVFLCPGTGTPTTAPAVCTGPGANANPANDQDAFTDVSLVPFTLLPSH